MLQAVIYIPLNKSFVHIQNKNSNACGFKKDIFSQGNKELGFWVDFGALVGFYIVATAVLITYFW